jgi:flagellar motor switch protein FliN
MSEIENSQNIKRLLDVEMGVTVRFGATKIPLREVVNFGNGSMIELNRMVDEPVELLVNNYPFARGEVVVIDGYYSVKITEIESPEKRSSTFFPSKEEESVKESKPQIQTPQNNPTPKAKTPGEPVKSEPVKTGQPAAQKPQSNVPKTGEAQQTTPPKPVQQSEPPKKKEE